MQANILCNFGVGKIILIYKSNGLGKIILIYKSNCFFFPLQSVLVIYEGNSFTPPSPLAAHQLDPK